MQSQQVIIVGSSRLVCELLRRVIEKTPEFEVISETREWAELPIIAKQVNADWLFIVLSPEEELPETLIAELLLIRPTFHIITFWMDGSHVRTEWLSFQELDFSGTTLSQLASLLEKEWWIKHSGTEQ